MLRRVEIRNFKAIDHAQLELGAFNVLVGRNGSGKSSILQALHWVFQSGRNPRVAQANIEKASTLSERAAIYMPSKEYLMSAHGQRYGNKMDSPRLTLDVNYELNDQTVSAQLWLKAARNEGLSVHVPSNNAFVSELRNRKREFSSYIPGLSGVPLEEVLRSKAVVQSYAASGEANLVLRNIMYLLSQQGSHPDLPSLKDLSRIVSSILGEIEFRVSFDPKQDMHLNVEFCLVASKTDVSSNFKPIEFLGLGYLQVIQIFCYLLVYRPRLLLIDEPDSHLHAAAHGKLVSVLLAECLNFDFQVILSSHSPAVMRGLPVDANVIWMHGGKQQVESREQIRKSMGWGLLDKKLLLITEDRDVSLLTALLSQRPKLERYIAVWPVGGCSSLPRADAANELKNLLGDQVKILLHHDRDFLMDEEIELVSKRYDGDGIRVWCSKYCDLEAYWCSAEAVMALNSLSFERAEKIVSDAYADIDSEELIKTFNRKRFNISNERLRPQASKGMIVLKDADVARAIVKKAGYQYDAVGKTLLKSIRNQLNSMNIHGSQHYGKSPYIGADYGMADDLFSKIQEFI